MEAPIMSSEQIQDLCELCPTRGELAAFSAGRLSLPHLERLAAHLELCQRCSSAIENSQPSDDALLMALRGPVAEESFFMEPECEALEVRAKALAYQIKNRGSKHWLDTLEDRNISLIKQLSQSENGYGLVYQATDATARHLAIRLLPRSCRSSEERCGRYAEKTSAAAKRTCGQVLPVLEVLEHDGRLALLSPYVHGWSLAQVIANRRALRDNKGNTQVHPLVVASEKCYLQMALGVFDQIIGLVAALHAEDQTYPELRPSSCLLDGQGKIWLADYGLWQFSGGFGGIQPLPTSDEHSAFLPSVPGYLSPEEWGGRWQHDFSLDVFRLGVLCYQLLTLELPYGIAPLTPKKHAPLLPSQRQPLIGQELDGLILRCLEVDRGKRFLTAKDVKEAWTEARGRGWLGWWGDRVRGWLRLGTKSQ
jgi:hypothetical protein